MSLRRVPGLVPVPEPFMSPRRVRRLYDAAGLESGGGSRGVAYPSLVVALRRAVETAALVPEPLRAEVDRELAVRAQQRPHTNKFYGTIRCMEEVVAKMPEAERMAVLRADYDSMEDTWQTFTASCGAQLSVGVFAHDEDWALRFDMQTGGASAEYFTDILIRDISADEVGAAFSESLLDGATEYDSRMIICRSVPQSEFGSPGTFVAVENHRGGARCFTVNTFTERGENSETAWPLQIGQAFMVAVMRICEQRAHVDHHT